MKRTLAALALLFGIAPAIAADLPVKAPIYAPVPYSWTSFYVGGYLGDGFSSFPLQFGTDSRVAAALSPGVLGPANSALLAGGMIGFNYQAGAFVFGASLEGGFTGFNNRNAGIENIVQTQASVPWDIAILGRLGFTPSQRVWLYAIVGGEGAEIDHAAQVCGITSTPCASASNTNVHFGWTAGAGIQWAPEFVAPFRLGLEYRFVDVGTTAVDLSFPAGETSVIIHSADTARWNQVVVTATYPFGYSN